MRRPLEAVSTASVSLTREKPQNTTRRVLVVSQGQTSLPQPHQNPGIGQTWRCVRQMWSNQARRYRLTYIHPAQRCSAICSTILVSRQSCTALTPVVMGYLHEDEGRRMFELFHEFMNTEIALLDKERT